MSLKLFYSYAYTILAQKRFSAIGIKIFTFFKGIPALSTEPKTSNPFIIKNMVMSVLKIIFRSGIYRVYSFY